MSNSKNTLRIFCTLLVMQFLALPLFSQKSVHYVYDYTGKRTHKYTKTSETIYFNQFYSVRYDKNGSLAGGQIIKHIYLGNERIVTKVVSKKNPSYSEEAHRIYYFHTDHLGSAQLITDFEGREYQRIEYTPYGETWVERTSNTGREYLPYKFTGKEQDEETGLYYFGARYLDPQYSRWLSTDPALGEYVPMAGNDNSQLPNGGAYNYINFSLYHYSNNNPIKYTDPDGRSPVYDVEGNLIGVTEDTGLQGTPLIMNPEDYSAKMSTDEANNKNLGLARLKDENAISKFIASFSSLSDRPDWDGRLTLKEANDWYRNGNGEPLYVDINLIDLSMLGSLGDDYVGKDYAFNLQKLGSKDGLVYGSVTFKRYPNDTCRAYADTYDFDYHRGIKSLPRNIATFFGSLYAGKGTQYQINIYGEKKLPR